ncbi:ephrin type-A receptor 3-like [Aphis gossypii]|uniref:ephrin type-A receptor 3-like n=1 Tax=Aphis gossypii TaxID=80765 RepID=UPI00215926F9|nr:ephrin type-A receptor 3-like [Aphis gossypii]
MSTDKMQCKCGLWCAFLVFLAVSAVSAAQLIKDDLMVVIPTSMPADDGRSTTDYRRQRNVTTRPVVGALRRTPMPPLNRGGSGPISLDPLSDVDETSMPRVKKKIKHKRTWDEPEAQGSEVRNATSKRPDRIKTRRRLLVPSSSTARALRTAAISSLQEDPYYDFGKKIRHSSQPPSPQSTVDGLDASSDSETRTSLRLPVVVQQVQDATPRTRALPPPHNRNHSTVATTRRPVENSAAPAVECLYPRFTRRNNKSRTRRDVRCLPESDSRTTRILSTVVTSVSVKGSSQKKNDSSAELGQHSIENHRLNANSDGDATGAYNPGPLTSTVSSEPAIAVSAYPKYLRNRYRNISLPEYLEITKVNQRRLNGTTLAGIASIVSTTASTITASTTSTSTVTTASGSSSPDRPVVGTTETLDASNINDRSSTETPQPPPTDLQDFIYLNNGTSEAPVDDIATDVAAPIVSTTTTVDTAVEARQRRPLLQRNNITRLSAEHDVGVVYPDGLATSVYFLTFLAIVPLVLVIVFAFKLAMRRKKKKVFDSSEYSSEYNRSPLDFNTITSSPITTKLPRVPQHIVWDAEKTPAVPVPMSNSRWEFPREKLRLQTILGQGNFGQVWKAEADDISGHEGLTRLVAVKMVKEDAASREREDLIRELSIMQHLGSHPNVVTLLGCCTEKEPYLLIMEYVMYGKLLAFLRDRRTRSHYFNFSDSTASLTSRDLTMFAYCVARGMDFLVSKKIVHRDLAARNVLVDHNKLCKIADFGMSRNVRDTNQIYEQRHTKGALPIRWMAPESLHYSIFTYKTDVWSFGVLMWEIVTLGSTPYCTMGAREVMRRVREGYRLDKPAHCRSELFRVITKCWAADPSKRPTFAELKQELGALLENPEFEGSYVDLESLVDESDSNAKDRQ